MYVSRVKNSKLNKTTGQLEIHCYFVHGLVNSIINYYLHTLQILLIIDIGSLN